MNITFYKLLLFKFLFQIDTNVLDKLLNLQFNMFNLLNIVFSRNMTKRKRHFKNKGKEDKRNEEDKVGSIVWAKMKGIPSTMMWPVRLEGVETGGTFSVFCNADQAM
jgi:hypothetical protein